MTNQLVQVTEKNNNITDQITKISNENKRIKKGSIESEKKFQNDIDNLYNEIDKLK